MIQAINVSLRFGKKALFEDVNVTFSPGNCYGIIGANGAGKSTFLRILSGELEPTKGEVVTTPGERISFLKQDHFQYDEYTVLDTVMLGNPRLLEVMHEKDALYAKEDFTDEDGIKASELEAEFANMNGWEAESDAATLLNGLGVDTEHHYKLMKDLDGALKCAGKLDRIEEKYIDAAAAVSGCGPAFVYMFIEALSDGAVACGLPRDKALAYAKQTVLGAAALAIEFPPARRPCCSPPTACAPTCPTR